MLYCKRRRRRGFKKRYIVIPALLLILGSLIHGFEGKASTFSKSYIPAFAERCATEAVNDAVTEKLQELHYSYGDLAKIVYAKDGNPQAIETDSAAINLLKAETTRAAQDELTKIKHSKIEIPLGAFTGFTLISNLGPEIPLTYCMTGSFNSRLESSFETAGINQTIHHIRLVVTAQIVTASVDYEEPISFETDFDVAQSVITGEIPQYMVERRQLFNEIS